jgi:hypothetical protein
MPVDSPRDIRQYFSPPRGGRQPSDSNQQLRGTPHAHGVSPTGHNQQQQQQRTPNRRRIITSDDDVPIAAGNGQAAAEVQSAELQRHDPVDPAIVIESSEDSEPDDIWVRPRRSALQQQQEQQQAPIQPHAATAEHLASPRNRRRQQPPPHQTSPRQRRRLEAAAEESAASDGDSSDCIESDTNAQDLYRAAIRGVRNARQARQQIRAVTEHCPVCSKFAAFIVNFM